MSPPNPPTAKRHPHTLTAHGHTRVDPYYWLRDKDNPEVRAYLEAENAYTDAVMAPTEPLQETLFNELYGRLPDEQTFSVRVGPYDYFIRYEKNKPYPVYGRKSASAPNAASDEEVLLDLNAFDGDYVNVGAFRVSPDHRYLAYALDTDGSEAFTLRVKDLHTGEHLPERVQNLASALEWANDSRTLFYVTRDAAARPATLFRHRLGADPAADERLYFEADGLYSLSLGKTKDQAYVVLYVNSSETSEVYTLAASAPDGAFGCVHRRQKGLRVDKLEHRAGHYYLLTNADAPNYRVVTAPVEETQRASWRDLVPHRDEVKLEGFDLFAEHLTLYGRENGLRILKVMHLGSGVTRAVDFPEGVYTYVPRYPEDPAWNDVPDANPDFDAPALRLTYSSPLTPPTVYDYLLEEGRLEPKQQRVVPGFSSEDYRAERLFVEAEDGALVPVSLVYKKGLKRDGANPCLLYGYGSYGATVEPGFSAHRLSLLDRGFICATAHVRGGGEIGRSWYEGGKYLHKRNTFTDFIACAKHLCEKGYTTPEKLTITGRSAGGLLIGAVLNLAPELFKVAIAEVPFVDVVTTMLDENIPLTVGEFEEWGNPKEKPYYDYLLSYSPYDNVERKAYPRLLVSAGLNDPRVGYWEPAKWVAKLRASKTDGNLLLLKTYMGAGHGGPGNRLETLREVAFVYAFILGAMV